MIAIADSSVLILYAKAGYFDILRDVFQKIIIPPAVWNEVVIAGQRHPDASAINRIPWIELWPDTPTAIPTLHGLGSGETDVIQLAVQLEHHEFVLLDDRQARKAAASHGVKVIGSAGILIVAKELGIIPEVRPLIFRLRQLGLFLSDSALETILVRAGEY